MRENRQNNCHCSKLSYLGQFVTQKQIKSTSRLRSSSRLVLLRATPFHSFSCCFYLAVSSLRVNLLLLPSVSYTLPFDFLFRKMKVFYTYVTLPSHCYFLRHPDVIISKCWLSQYLFFALLLLLLIHKSYFLLSQFMHNHYIPFLILLDFSFAQFPIPFSLPFSTLQPNCKGPE